MNLYDSIIKHAEELKGSSAAKRYVYSPDRCWEDVGANELVMMKDSAFELGGEGKPAVNYTCVTSDSALVAEDEILVIGKDISEISSDVPFARIAIVRVGDIDELGEEDSEKLFRAIQDIDFVKYHVFPKGYMVRSSGESFREQVRVSKSSKLGGMSFEGIGNDYIKNYKKNKNIEAVKLMFITAPDADYKGMLADAKTVHDITLTLSKILEGMPTDCSSCGLKDVCDEVEGLKELHFGIGAEGAEAK